MEKEKLLQSGNIVECANGCVYLLVDVAECEEMMYFGSNGGFNTFEDLINDEFDTDGWDIKTIYVPKDASHLTDFFARYTEFISERFNIYHFND